MTLLERALARYRRTGPQLPNGLVRKYRARPEDFDRRELARGVRVEMEHTSDPGLALEIAMAHLLERHDYYERLARMERAGRRKRRRA